MNGKLYIDVMSEDMRDKWYNNLSTIQIDIWEKHDFDSFRFFISGTINWATTNEGHEYWARIHFDDVLNTEIEREVKFIELGV